MDENSNTNEQAWMLYSVTTISQPIKVEIDAIIGAFLNELTLLRPWNLD
jgi:hypothetical protein